ncbi:MAG: ABC transporter substrate-binding protein [Deltaproteobacteria bacterium]|nr:ABC transporter substrate-binding protein [Deltaproteobacteria bacterium]
MRDSRRIIIGFAALALIAFVSGFAGVPCGLAQQKEPVKIGVLIPLTGSSGFGGERELRGIKIALEEINELGGVLGGRPVKIIVEDTESRPKAGMDGIHKLVDVDKVPIVLGAHNSSVTIPTATYANSRGVVQISLASTSPDLHKIGPFHFSVVATDEIMGADMVRFAMKDTGQKDFGILVMNDPYGVGLGRAMRKVIEDAGGRVVSEVRYELNKSDYRAELQRLFAPRPPAILSVAWAEMSRIIQKQAYEMGLSATVKDSWYSAYFADSVEACIPETVEGRKGLDVVAAKGPRFDEFAEKYRKLVGDKAEFISYYPPIAYDGMWIAALAIDMAGTTDPDTIRRVLPVTFKLYRGVSDPDMSVDEDGIQRTQIFQGYVYRDGKVVPYDVKW